MITESAEYCFKSAFPAAEIHELRDGIQISIEGYKLHFIYRGTDQLVITFDPHADEYEDGRYRYAWSEKFLRRQGGLSALHVKPDIADWYLRPSLALAFKALNESGFFDCFMNRLTYGSSMGGFGALAYTGLSKATRVLSYNPQVDLSPRVRSWEDRFEKALRMNWEQPVCNIDENIKKAEHVYCVYDPYQFHDRRQANLLTGENVMRLHVPFVGHSMPTHVRDLGMLIPLFCQAIGDGIDEKAFYREIRKRRHLERFQAVLLKTAKGNKLRRSRLREIFSQLSAKNEAVAD